MMVEHVLAAYHHIVRDGEGHQGTGAHHERRGLGLPRLLDNQLRGVRVRVILVSRDGLVGVVVDVDVGETLQMLWRWRRRGDR